MDRIWLEHYPRGVPAEIDVNEYASVREVFEESCRKFADAAGILVHGQARSRSPSSTRCPPTFGAWLQASGCAKGTRVALMMPNILQYPVCLFGALRAGLHGGQRQSALHARASSSTSSTIPAPKSIVVVENFAHTLQEVRRAARRSGTWS